ncbi:hypothetical protein EV385_5148 [Krasilnikovia cinnamomea]|uniref:Thrombospondin type 3 repeat-containing protein n=1 Tax=Krasilnikovia cinnamomea TaxID=349313 RepID=A0A4Q7ZRW5_9ACTN|nr:Midasin [Krasilnikovia cinnamomea]RZU53245.1 hypothetical protein EV385_5148 [Krasilnikovia cinnamomea]
MRILRITATSLLAVAASSAFAMPAQAAPKDSDHDGMPNSWEIKHKLNPRSKADARKDLDGDRLPNVLEYRLGGNPRDEDTDNDGQDDGDERNTRTRVDKADTDGDHILDGDEDCDHDGVANEDEDDATERCAKDDDDVDRDFVADEDENDLGLRVGDRDTDADGVPDGSEDRDRDGRANEDEDDSGHDACDGDRDHDGKRDEDEADRLGTVESFEMGTGALVVVTTTGSRLSAKVTDDTEIEFEDGHDAEEEGADVSVLPQAPESRSWS